MSEDKKEKSKHDFVRDIPKSNTAVCLKYTRRVPGNGTEYANETCPGPHPSAKDQLIEARRKEAVRFDAENKGMENKA